MQGLGYKELFGYFEGEYPLEEAVRIIQRDTRHFAKRQLTWFRRERDVIWIDKSIVGRDGGVDINKAPVLEEAVDGVGGHAAHPEGGGEQVGPGAAGAGWCAETPRCGASFAGGSRGRRDPPPRWRRPLPPKAVWPRG